MENKFTVYIEKDWLSGDIDIEIFNIPNQFDRLQVKSFLSNKRKKFVEKLQNKGINITFNKEDITNDTICLIMDDTSLCDKNVKVEEYKKIFDKKIFESAGENFNYPISVSVKDFFDNPFFPVAFKNEFANGGIDKFLIENNEQLEIIKSFYKENYNNTTYKNAFDNSIFQQYLETPSKYATYLRVLVAASGDVMGASLKYSKEVIDNSIKGIFEKVFLDSNSKYFLNSTKLFNYYSGGENIYFSQPKFSSEKERLLKEHGLNPNRLTIPNEVLDVCQNIMQNCNREIGILCGIDFMLNKNDGKWYYLENQGFPAIEEWAKARNISIPSSKNLKSSMRYLELELQAREEALDLYVNKKMSEKKSDNQPVLKKSIYN